MFFKRVDHTEGHLKTRVERREIISVPRNFLKYKKSSSALLHLHTGASLNLSKHMKSIIHRFNMLKRVASQQKKRESFFKSPKDLSNEDETEFATDWSRVYV